MKTLLRAFPTPKSLSRLPCYFSTSISSSFQNKNHIQQDNTTHFGFKTVLESEKQTMVNSVFRNVASQYDLMNDLMSAGLHRCWKDTVLNLVDPQVATMPNQQITYLDVAGGTGDVAFRIFDRIQQKKQKISSNIENAATKVIVCDINANMLGVGREKAVERNYLSKDELQYEISSQVDWSKDLQFVQGNAEELSSIPDNSVDAYTICFGIRNCTHIDKVLKEANRVLKRGGVFVCLEFSQVNNPILQKVYDLYSFQVIPPMGQLVANDFQSYQYLVESIRKFPNQEKFKAMIQEAGFKHVQYHDLTFGVVAIHTGVKL